MSVAMVKYTNKENQFDMVIIKEDDSFVIVGDTEPSEAEIQDMVSWYDVEGWDFMAC